MAGGGVGTAEEFDLEELKRLGAMLGPGEGGGATRFAYLGGMGLGEFLAGELLKVRGKDGVVRPLRANAAQRAFERRRGAGNIVLKARQMGMTTWVAGRFLLKTVTRPGTLTVQAAHTQEAAEEMLRIVHRFVEHLPADLRVGALKTEKANVRQIVFPKIDSEYRVVSAADRNAGRGMTYQNLHCSEVSRWGAGAADVLAGLRAGLAEGKEAGAELVLESTPCGAEGCFYEEWQRAEETGVVRHFFPWWLEEVYRTEPVAEDSLTEEEMELVTRPEDALGQALDLGQIGYRRKIRLDMGAMARQEFAEDAETCFLVSGESYFEKDAVEKRLAEVAEPYLKKYNGRLEVWYPPVPGHEYLLAVDPAGGGADGDYSAMQVLDIESGLQCAEFAGKVGGHELMVLAREVGWDYAGATIVVERNNHGSGLLALLLEVNYVRIYKASDGQLGFLTTVLSKPAILARMSLALVEEPGKFNSRKLLVECRSFVRLRDGGLGARNGAHDDRVMAMAVGLAARGEMLGTGNRVQGIGNRGRALHEFDDRPTQ
jgi:hypothetical protein